jgi:succinate dehydrogenase/fumarate reductase flavoprotein subunit
MELLEELAEKHPDRVRLIKKANVKQLIKDAQGVVIGVEYETDGQRHQEHGPVIVATGGYAADFTDTSLLKKYRPELWDLPTTNGDYSTGDGIKMVSAIGGNTVDLEKVQGVLIFVVLLVLMYSAPDWLG